MRRTQATSKFNKKTKKREGGLVTQDKMDKVIKDYGVELRGGGLDESPFVYRKLQEVIDAHKGTIEVLNVLRPVGVSMRSEEHTSELQSRGHLVCRLLLEKKNKTKQNI